MGKEITYTKVSPRDWTVLVDGMCEGSITRHTEGGRVRAYNVSTWDLEDQEVFLSRLHGGAHGAFKAAKDYVDRHFA